MRRLGSRDSKPVPYACMMHASRRVTQRSRLLRGGFMPDVKKRLLPREGLRGSGMIDSIIEASGAESLVTRFF
jgi:hypothetical protein